MAPPKKKARTPEATRLEVALKPLGTQKDAAVTAGVSPRQLRKYLTGESAPPAEVLAKIANKSGYSLNWLITGQGPPRVLVDAAIPLPGNIPAVLEVRRRLYEELSELYKGTSWPLSPGSDADEFLLIDATDTICNLPPEAWESAVELFVEGHRRALGRTKRKSQV